MTIEKIFVIVFSCNGRNDYMEKILICEELFMKGNFSKAKTSLHSLYNTVEGRGTTDKIFGYDCSVLNWILENNFLVTSAVEYMLTEVSFTNEIEVLNKQFYDLHLKIRALQKVVDVPLNLSLAVAQNVLWLSFVKSRSLKHDYETISKCIYIVQHVLMQFSITLKCDTASDVSDNSWINLKYLVHQLDEIKCHMYKLNDNNLRLQFLEAQSLLILVLLERKEKSNVENIIKYLDFCMYMKNHQKQFTQELKKSEEKEMDIENSHKVKIFKFSLARLNGTADELNSNVVFFMVSLVGSLISIRLQKWQQSLEFLNYVDGTGECSVFSGLINFLKAYSYYHNDELMECETLITQASDFPMSQHLKIRYNILHSVILEENGLYRSAIEILSKSNKNPVALFQMALCYESLREEVFRAGSTATCVVQEVNDAHLNVLHELVNVLSAHDNVNILEDICFTWEKRILDIVFFEPEITLTAALYKLARLQFSNQDMIGAVDSYEQLNCLLTKGEVLVWSLPTSFPSQHEISHELALALLKADMLDKARKVLNDQLFDCNVNDVIAGISGIHVDVIALILLAKLYNSEGDYVQEIETLDRCLNSLRNATSNIPCNIQGKTIIDCLSAKVWLQRGINCTKRYCEEDSKHAFSQALLCNKEDIDVVYYYCKSLQLEGYRLWKELHHSCRSIYIPEEIDLALQFILSDTVTLDDKEQFTETANCID